MNVTATEAILRNEFTQWPPPPYSQMFPELFPDPRVDVVDGISVWEPGIDDVVFIDDETFLLYTGESGHEQRLIAEIARWGHEVTGHVIKITKAERRFSIRGHDVYFEEV